MASFIVLLLIAGLAISSTVSLGESSDSIPFDNDFKVVDYMIKFSANLASFSEKLNSLNDKVRQIQADSEHTQKELSALKTTVTCFGDCRKDAKVNHPGLLDRLEDDASDDMSKGNESVSKQPTCSRRLSDLEILLSKVHTSLGQVPAFSSLFSSLEQNVSHIQEKQEASEEQISSLGDRLLNLERHVVNIQDFLDMLLDEVPTLRKRVESLEVNVSECFTVVYPSLRDLPDLKADIVSLKQNVSDIKARTVESGGERKFRKGTHGPVSFESWMRASYNVEHPGGTNIIFNNVQHNVGDGYSPLTGMFTAPVSGLYLLWAQVEKKKPSAVPLYMMRTGSGSIGYFYTPAGGTASGTVIAATHLQEGDTVYVATPGEERIGGRSHSKFGGTLLLEQ